MKAKKLSLNVKKTELMIFDSNRKKVDESVKFKLGGKRLLPSDSVNYLSIVLDKHL